MAQTLVESRAVFKERAQRVGLPESARDRLIAQGVDTLAKLAFASGNPGEAPTEAILKQLIEEQGKPAPSVGTIAAVRHLVFEAQTVLVSQTKAMTETREEVKELAPAERRARVRDQATRLKGIPMTGQSECAHASYDLVMKMMTDNCVHYLPPSKFITREAELRHDKPQKELDVQGSSIIVKPKEPDQSCDTSTALSLHHALQRRSLALDVVGATDYFKVQASSDFLMSHLREPAMQGFKPTTVQQVLAADRAVWVRLSELTPDGIRADSAGNLPLDALWARLENDPKVVFHLLPQASSGHAASGAAKRGADQASLDQDPGSQKPGKKPRKGKGKGKAQPPKEPANVPDELKGLCSFTKTGKRRCWSFNMTCGCSQAKIGQECPRRLHVCVRCGGHHAAHACPEKGLTNSRSRAFARNGGLSMHEQ